MKKEYTCKDCPCYDTCTAEYRSSDCAANRAKANIDEDPNYDFHVRELNTQHSIVDAWLRNDHDEEFERQLRIQLQKVQRIERAAITANEVPAYEIGVTAGYIRAIEALYRDKESMQKAELCVACAWDCTQKEMQNMLKYMHEHPDGSTIEELAEAANVYPIMVTNEFDRGHMQYLVEHFATHRAVKYRLTKVGEDYVGRKLMK